MALVVSHHTGGSQGALEEIRCGKPTGPTPNTICTTRCNDSSVNADTELSTLIYAAAMAPATMTSPCAMQTSFQGLRAARPSTKVHNA